jgi:hypothetical protein
MDGMFRLSVAGKPKLLKIYTSVALLYEIVTLTDNDCCFLIVKQDCRVANNVVDHQIASPTETACMYKYVRE